MADDIYTKKMESLQKYVPFLINMMTELKAKGNREAQLEKMQSLHKMITSSKKKLKLETLTKCEDVLNNIYFKVNPQLKLKDPFSLSTVVNVDSPSNSVPDVESPLSTPASPSPPPDILKSEPVTIPTEKISFQLKRPRTSSIVKKYSLPKVNVYNNVVINKPPKIITPMVPDMSKPPISLDDLRTLQDDANQKITDSILDNASVDELQEYKKQLQLQIRVESISSIMASDQERTDSQQSTSSSSKFLLKGENVVKPANMPQEKKSTKVVVLKEPDSVFGNILSGIDGKLLDDKKKNKKIERRLSVSTDHIFSKDSASNAMQLNDKKDTKVYKRLADKYNPKPRQKCDIEKQVEDVIEENMKINSPMQLNSPKTALPPILQNLFNKPSSEVSNNVMEVGPMRQLCEPPMPSPLLQLLSPKPNTLPTAQPMVSPVFTPAPYIPNSDMIMMPPGLQTYEAQPGFGSPRMDMDLRRMDFNSQKLDFEPPTHIRDQSYNLNQRFIPPIVNQFQPQEWGMPFYAPNNQIMEQPHFYQENQWNEMYRQRGRRPGDPRNYKEYKEIKEREARAFREKQEIKDPRRLSQENKGGLIENRDPRIAMAASRDPRLARLRESNPIQIDRTPKPKVTHAIAINSESKFDKMYANTNKPRSATTADKKDGDSDSFLSPLDKLYMSGDSDKTGRGYGVQHFKIPKKLKVPNLKHSANKPDDASSEQSEVDSRMDLESDKDSENIEDALEPDKTSVEEVLIPEPVKPAEQETPVVRAPKRRFRRSRRQKRKRKLIIDSDLEDENDSSLFDQTEKMVSGINLSQIIVSVDHDKRKDVKEDAWIKEDIPDSLSFVSEYERESVQLADTSTANVKSCEAVTLSDSSEIDKPSTSAVISTDQNKELEAAPLLAVSEMDVKPKSEEPLEQNILVHFFENLLKSNNKNDKKSALFSLIETFSDSFERTEFQKIRQIIQVSQTPDADNGEPEKEPEVKQIEESNPEVGSTTGDPPELPTLETAPNIETVNTDIDTVNSVVSSETEVDSHIEPLIQESVVEPIKIKTRSSVAVKAKKRPRTELDMLHEDIQEMFIRDGVLTATGKRMCRILKNDLNDFEDDKKKTRKSRVSPKRKAGKDELQSSMKDIRILIEKMPDDVMTANTRKESDVESDDEQEDEKEEMKADCNETVRIEEELETDEEEHKSVGPKGTKRGRKRQWASGIIPKGKRKKNEEKIADKPEEILLDKSYYIDHTKKKRLVCKLCPITGFSLTSHYIREHPESEVLCSRMCPEEISSAIDDFKTHHKLYHYSDLSKRISYKYQFACRFCRFSSFTHPIFFYEHVTTHTGEYRYQCDTCKFRCASGKALTAHGFANHPKDQRKKNRVSYQKILIFGYICGACNFVQLNKDNIERHIHYHHPGDNTTIYKINLSKVVDPTLLSANAINDTIGEASLSPTVDSESSNVPAALTFSDNSNDNELIKTKATAAELPEMCAEEKLDSTPIKKKPGPKSKTMIVKPDSTKEQPQQIIQKRKPGPKSKTQVIVSTPVNTCMDMPVLTPELLPTLPAINDEIAKQTTIRKRRRSLEKLIAQDGNDDLDTIITLSSRSNRAAKDKATAKLKTLMENNEEASTAKLPSVQPKVIPTEEKSVEDDLRSETNMNDAKKDVKLVNEKEECTNKEPEMNVFLCKTDIIEEDAKLIEKERLRTMDELTKSMKSRVSKLNFVDKLRDFLNNEKDKQDTCVNNVISEVKVKTEKIDPVPHKSTSLIPDEVISSNFSNKITNFPIESPFKKPVFEDDSLSVPANVEFKQNKSVSLFTSTIEKLQGKLFESSIQTDLASGTVSESIGAADEFVFDGLMKVIKQGSDNVFSCLVDNCYVITKDKSVFQLHCKFGHQDFKSTSALCDKCGIALDRIHDTNLLEIVFDHIEFAHSNFLEGKMEHSEDRLSLRPRRLSGDKLSLKSEQEPVPTMATVNLADDNPFSFKIVDVISLADNTPPSPVKPVLIKPLPPLKPIAQSNSGPFIAVESKMTVSELTRPRKCPKALSSFIANPDLYKCPHFYCTFTTNVGSFLERHLKVHNNNTETMVPCVYCDIKTPWDHVPIHINIRHAHCRFACNYCLYRAVARDYVLLHQSQNHPGNKKIVIYLPPHKTSRKFKLSNSKAELRSICQPLRCLCNENTVKEYLFVNEFYTHLMTNHQKAYATCGYPGCNRRIYSDLMVGHWSVFHGISNYQCGNCNASEKDISQMYRHFAKFHPGLQLNIYVRILDNIQKKEELLYTEEAFKKLISVSKISNLKALIGKGQITLRKPVASASTEPPPTPLVLQPISGISTGQGPPTKIILPTSNVQVVLASSSENLFILPTSNINSPKHITSIAPMSPVVTKTSTCSKTNLTNLGGTSHVPVTTTVGDNQDDSNNITAVNITEEPEPSSPGGTQGPPPLVMIKEKTSNVTPMEHIIIPSDEGDSQLLSEEMDPLNIDDATFSNFDVELNSALREPLAVTSDSSTIKAGSFIDGQEKDNDPKSPVQLRSITSLLFSDDELSTNGLSGLELYKCGICLTSFPNSWLLKHHLIVSGPCKKPGAKPYNCFHCFRDLKSPSVLVEHIQIHGIERYICSLCNDRFPTLNIARAHNKTRHSVHHTTVVPLNANKTDSEKDMFVVKPAPNAPSTKEKDGLQESPKGVHVEPFYTPEQIDTIPKRQIFNSNVKCGLCNYQTKVRVNIIRHLQMHAEEKSVSDIAPVNPVPCLEKNEKMFDKMTNLAASSFTERMGGSKSIDKEEEKHPEFVPTYSRFVCCAQNCAYLCPEEANLKHHLMALHSDETEFTCAHCKKVITPTDAESVIKHFKLHGLHLYKCNYCKFIHHFKHKVEKHITDGHLDLAVKVITIRSMESEPQENREVEELASISPTKFKPWRCCMCKVKCSTKEDIQGHVVSKHDVDAQYKCTLCTFKNDQQDSFTKHFSENHPGIKIDFISMYQRVVEDVPRDESFDTTPLWQRDKPRIRHIRGILFEEMAPAPKAQKKSIKTSTPPKKSIPVKFTDNLEECINAVATGTDSILNKSTDMSEKNNEKEVTDVPPKTNETLLEAKTECIKHELLRDDTIIVIDSDDNEDVKQEDPEMIDTSQQGSFSETQINDDSREGSSMPYSDIDDDYEANMINKNILQSMYGRFGRPHRKQWWCPKCNQFKSKRVADIIFHMYKELNIFRYKCKICSTASITFKYMLDHLTHHPGESEEVIELLPRNLKMETWIHMMIRTQTLEIIKHAPVFKKPSTGKREVKCCFCNEMFVSMTECCEHMLYHWKVIPYQCNTCPLKYYNEFDLKQHYETEHPSVPMCLEPKGPTIEQAIANVENPNKKLLIINPIKSPKKLKLDVGEVIKIDSDDDDELTPSTSGTVQPKEPQLTGDDYKFTFPCKLCPKFYMSLGGLKMHMTMSHCPTAYPEFGVDTSEGSHKLYSCSFCQYYTIGTNTLIIKKHVRGHLHPIKCNICNSKFKYFKEAQDHHSKEHLYQMADITALPDMQREFAMTMDFIIRNATPVKSVRQVAKKSTSAPFKTELNTEESQDESAQAIDLKKITTTFELNNLEYTTSVEDMMKMININPYVDVTDFKNVDVPETI